MLADPQFRTDGAARLWSAETRLAHMLAFEAALAEALAETGLIPAPAAVLIAACARSGAFDAAGIFHQAARAGNPAIPLVKALTAAVAAVDGEAASFVHHGATSQDVIDTALMLGCRESVAALDTLLADSAALLRTLAERHAETPIAGRTLLQQATPITFGLKAALWLTAVNRARRRLAALAGDDLALQLGGATGALAAYGDTGPALRAALARRLGLADPGHCWHVLRDRPLAVAAALVAAVGVAAKICGDVILLMQSEVAEAFEGAVGGSSAMPHKRNPVAALAPPAMLPAASGLLAGLAANTAHAHERAAGAWHGEWLTLPELAALALGAAERLRDTLSGLEVDGERMAANLADSDGLLAAEALGRALTAHLGREEAHALVATLCRIAVANDYDLHDLALRDDRIAGSLGAQALRDIFDHRAALAAAAAETRRLLGDT